MLLNVFEFFLKKVFTAVKVFLIIKSLLTNKINLYFFLYSFCFRTEFFENLAEESRQASEKPLIMRNTVYARKTLARRAKTMKYINRKRSSSEY